MNAPIKCLKTTARVHHIQDKDTEHIRPLWVVQSRGSQVFQTHCEASTGAGCPILPAHTAQQLFGHEWLGQLNTPKVHIEAYGEQSVHNLGSCFLHLHIDNKAFPTIFEVTNMTGPVILGRTQANAMGYVQFPQIWRPHALTMFPDASRIEKYVHTGHPHQKLYYTAKHISPKRLDPKSLYTKPGK